MIASGWKKFPSTSAFLSVHRHLVPHLEALLGAPAKRSLPAKRRGMLLATGIAGSGSQLGDRIALLLQRGRAFTAGVSVPRVAICFSKN